ncbi:MAG: FAD-dependent oxidoreductase, partial [Armatimonadetes bacterium]|nr:FAD-dependent oxidoreductase [Armatimonadota bacterium]
MMSEHVTDVLVLGGGPAGIQGTRTLRKKRPDLRVTVLRPEQYSIIYCALPYALEGLFDLSKCYKRDELITEVGAELIREKATSVDLDQRVCATEGGTQIRYETLLIVTGANPFVPPVAGADLANIFTVKTGPDAQRIMRTLDSGARHVVVIGAGAIGVEQAAAYRHHGLEVDLVDMAETPLPALLDADFAPDAVAELEKLGVRLHLGKALGAFEGKEAVGGVVLQDGTRIELNEGSDFVVVAVGVRPTLDLFPEDVLERGKDGLIVDDHMRTAIEGVYAAGDCCQFYSAIDGKPAPGKLATNAVPMAKVAALNIAGGDVAYQGFVNGAATVVGDLRFGGTGFTEAIASKRGHTVVAGYGETTSRFPMLPGAAPVKVTIVAAVSTGPATR